MTAARGYEPVKIFYLVAYVNLVLKYQIFVSKKSEILAITVFNLMISWCSYEAFSMF